ncbi:MAG: ankyrin repeat domain-containing protein [Planctomycetota bacterium]
MRHWIFLFVVLLRVPSVPAEELSPFVDRAERGDWENVAGQIDAETARQTQGDGSTALHWAAHWNRPEIVDRLINAGATVDAANDYGVTPLAVACRLGNFEAADRLLNADADPALELPGRETLLMHVARVGNPKLVQRLIDCGVNVDAKQRRSQTALMWAAERGNVEAVDCLLKADADWGHKLKSGFTALHFAARQGRGRVVRRLLDAGADVNARMNPLNESGRNPRKGMSPLMLAVESAHFELALKLVQWGADPNDQRSRYAPLHALSWVRRPSRGDNPEGDPPPVGTGDIGSLQFARQMVELGADVNLRLTSGKHSKAKLNPRGATPFLLAAFTGDLAYARLLVELGADTTIPNADGTTPILAAAGVGIFVADEYPGDESETQAMLEQLVAWGANVNDVDNHDETVIHGAAYRSFAKVVDQLVELGADAQVWHRKNSIGSTPREVAQGKRPGSFKPNKATIAAIDRALDAAGLEPSHWVRPLDRKRDWDSPQ